MQFEVKVSKPVERNWLLQLDPSERTTLFATFSGWMLDGMNVMVYSFAMPALILLWHITKSQAGWLGTSALLFSSLGGWLAGLAADRWGRVRVLNWTIMWFAVFTFLSGCTNTFSQLFIMRGIQGLGFGGEWAVGSVLIGETIRAKFRGRAVGTTQSAWAIGWGIAALFYTVLFKFLSPDIAWRAMFWIGLLPVPLALWIQHHVHEPEVFECTRKQQSSGSSAHFLKIFAPAMLRTTMLASLVALGAQGGYYAVNTFLPLYLRARGLSVSSTGAYLMVVIAGSFAGYMTSAHLSDWIGRRWSLALFAIGSLLSVAAYMMLPIGNGATLLLGFPLGFFPSGSFSPMGSFFTELFPTSLRGSGQGFSYNFGRGIGALFPTLVGYFSAHMPLGRAIAVFSVASYMVMVVSVLLLPETQGRDLADLDRILQD
jgi:MFS family permease